MGIFDDLKSIGKILQEAGKIEEYREILEAQKELLEMQKKISDLEEENKELKEKLKIKENLFFENNAYWMRKNGEFKDGPFCSCCWDKTDKLVRMHSSDGTHFYCPACKIPIKIGPNYGSPYKQLNNNEDSYEF